MQVASAAILVLAFASLIYFAIPYAKTFKGR